MNNFGAVSSIVEMFGAIDNVSKSNDENGKIFSRILDKFHSLFLTNDNGANEKKGRINKYREYLEGFQSLIDQQIEVIDSAESGKENEIHENTDVMREMKESLMQYTMKQYALEFYDMSEMLSKKELEIYIYTYIHKMINEYSNAIDREVFADWKTYFYLGINIKNQLAINEILFSGKTAERMLKERQEPEGVNDFYIMDMQGQFARNVFYRRKKLHLTQAKLSEMSGVDRTMIAKIERVSQPVTFETAVKLLTALGMGIAFYPFGKAEESSCSEDHML